MKHIIILLYVLSISALGYCQNVGIGVPSPTQKLEVSGAIKVGTTATNQPGTIRFNGGKFEGGDGTTWKDLEALPVGGLVASKTYNNPALLAEGYTLAGEFPGITSYNTTTGSLSALQWWPTYINGVASNIPPPPGSDISVAVATGNLMYVVTPTNLYSYDPVTNVWTIVSNQGLAYSSNIKGIWTGTEIIFWNSVVGLGTLGHRYNPSTNVWTTLPTLNSPSQRTFYSMVWDGTRVIIWGGRDASLGGGGVSLNTGAFFNPSTNTWTTMNTTAAPIGRYFHTAVWDNLSNRMIVWGGTNGSLLNSGGLYNPTTNSWTGSTSLTNAPPGRIYHSAVWSGSEMIIYGGDDFNIITNNGGRYNPSTNTWTPISTVGANFTHKHAATWTGTQMIVTGGRPDFASNSPSTTLSSAYNPVTNTWLSLPNFNNAADAKDSHYSFLLGNMVLIWGGRNNTSTSGGSAPFNNTGYRYFLSNIVSSSTTIENNASLYLYQKN